MWKANDDEVEVLLRRDTRALLPFAHLLVLYLNPFALFKDASRGPDSVRQRALTYNRARRWMLLPYIKRWFLIGGSLFLGIGPVEALAAETSLFIVPAASFAVGSCIAAVVMVWTAMVYFLLGIRN